MVIVNSPIRKKGFFQKRGFSLLGVVVNYTTRKRRFFWKKNHFFDFGGSSFLPRENRTFLLEETRFSIVRKVVGHYPQIPKNAVSRFYGVHVYYHPGIGKARFSPE